MCTPNHLRTRIVPPGILFLVFLILLPGFASGEEGGAEEANDEAREGEYPEQAEEEPLDLLLWIEMDAAGNQQTGGTGEIRCGPGDDYTLTMKGNLTLLRTERFQDSIVNVELRLQFIDARGLVGSVEPMYTDFSPLINPRNIPVSSPISVNFMITPNSNFSTGGENFLFKVEIVGHYIISPAPGGPIMEGIVKPYPLHINVLPYHYFTFYFDPGLVEVSPGGTTEIELNIYNQGNAVERIDLWIVDEALWAREGWVFQFETTSIYVKPREYASVKLRITTPRRITGLFHMGDVRSFTVHAESYYSREDMLKGDTQKVVSWEMDFMISLLGVDFLYIPLAWALIFYVVLLLVTFNLGFNMFTLRRRRIYKDKEPGFFALYHFINKPENRERKRLEREERRRKLEEKRKLKQQLKEEARKERERIDLSEIDLDSRPEPGKVPAPLLPKPRKEKRSKEERGDKKKASIFGRKEAKGDESLAEALALLDEDGGPDRSGVETVKVLDLKVPERRDPVENPIGKGGKRGSFSMFGKSKRRREDDLKEAVSLLEEL